MFRPNLKIGVNLIEDTYVYWGIVPIYYPGAALEIRIEGAPNLFKPCPFIKKINFY